MAEPVPLPKIAEQMNLHPRTLYVLRDRHEDFPLPVASMGRFSLYDPDQIEIWYEARHLEMGA